LLLARLESLQSEPGSCKGANGRNPKQGLVKTSQRAWQVLRVALLFPILEKSFIRDFSPLKPLLVQGKWNRRRRTSRNSLTSTEGSYLPTERITSGKKPLQRGTKSGPGACGESSLD